MPKKRKESSACFWQSLCVLKILSLIFVLVSCEDERLVKKTEITTCPALKSNYNQYSGNNFIFPCLERQGSLLIQQCFQGQWYQQRIKSCPQPLSCLSNFIETQEGCLFITKPINHPGTKPYEFNENSFSAPPSKDKLYWAPLMITTNNGLFAPKLSQRNNRTLMKTSRKEDCAVVNITTQEIRSVNCHEKHSMVYTYDKIDNCKCFPRIRTCRTMDHIVGIHNKNIFTNDSCYAENVFLQSEQGCVCVSKLTLENVSMLLTFEDSTKSLLLFVYNAGNQSMYFEPQCYIGTLGLENQQVHIKPYSDSEQVTYMNVYELELKYYMDYYFCTLSVYGGVYFIESNRVLAYNSTVGNEYSLHLIVDNAHSNQYIPMEELNQVFGTKTRYAIRISAILNYSQHHLEYLLHINTLIERDLVEEYSEFLRSLQNINENIRVVSFSSSLYCLPDKNNEMTWPLTPISEAAISEEACLQENGLPVSRVCGGDFIVGAHWLEVSGNCSSGPSDVSGYIRSIMEEKITKVHLKNISNILKGDVGVLDMYFVSKIIRNVSDEPELYHGLVKIVSEMLSKEPNLLREAQEHLNVTDDVLDAMDSLGLKTKDALEDNKGHYLFKDTNIVVRITKPFVTNISGIAVFANATGQLFIDDIERGNTIENLKTLHDLQLATFVPDDVLSKLDPNTYILFVLYKNDKLFVTDPQLNQKPSGVIVSVSIPNYGQVILESLPVLFRSQPEQGPVQCAFWDYGKRTSRKKGNWSNIGVTYKSHEDKPDIHTCYYTHLTHFSLLMLSQQEMIFSPQGLLYLNILNFVADILTIIGLTGIMLTAIFFDKWRSKPGTKILVNMCFAIGAEIVVMKLCEDISSCTVIGPLFHYIVVSKFCWMLVYAFLQYMRFVKVLGPVPTNIVAKSAVFGWGFALLPVGIILMIDPYSYSLQRYHMCVPEGSGMYFGVLLPIFSIILTNFVVFCIVMREIWTKNIESHSKFSNTYKVQMQMATLLFFILGVPTFIQILSNFIIECLAKEIMIYICSVLSNIQGFILFLFYVIFNKETRTCWMKCYYKNNGRPLVTPSASK